MKFSQRPPRKENEEKKSFIYVKSVWYEIINRKTFAFVAILEEMKEVCHSRLNWAEGFIMKRKIMENFNVMVSIPGAGKLG